jgi:hypothetical protein
MIEDEMYETHIACDMTWKMFELETSRILYASFVGSSYT